MTKILSFIQEFQFQQRKRPKRKTTSDLKLKGMKKQQIKPKIKANDQQKTKERSLSGNDQTGWSWDER